MLRTEGKAFPSLCEVDIPPNLFFFHISIMFEEEQMRCLYNQQAKRTISMPIFSHLLKTAQYL
uniref:Uncharacterized protein n=1 Tax=Arion vulgaris TaxID=1028688 RepID=A0A0B6ZC79_9EUPU